MKRKRILFYSPYSLENVTHGGARRSQLIWNMLREEYEVHVIVHARDVAPQAHAGFDALVVRHSYQRFVDSRLARVVLKRIASFSPDLFWIEQFYCVPYLARLARRVSIPVLYSSQNIEFERFGSWSRYHAFVVGLYERWVVHSSDYILCVSQRDRGLISLRYGFPKDRAFVSSNAYDDSLFQPKKLERMEKRKWWREHGVDGFSHYVVFVGGYSYEPNREAIEEIETVVAPRLLELEPEAAILLIGTGLAAKPPSRCPNVIAVGEVEHIEKFLQASDLAICPIKGGGGTRFKIIEALACGLPVVTTDKGAEGLERLGPGEGLLRSALGDFANTISRTLRVPREPQEITDPIRQYSYTAVRAQTLAVVDSILGVDTESGRSLDVYPPRNCATNHD